MAIIMHFSEEYLPKLMEISKAELGSDYLEGDDFLMTLGSKDDFCLVAVDETGPIGFAICNVFGKEGVDPILHMPDCPERDEMLSIGRIGYLASVAVLDSAKGKGAGTLLVDAAEREFDRRRVDASCAMAWKAVQGYVNIAKVVERAGMTAVAEYQGYWNDPRAFPNGHDCPVCGNPCKCSAVFYLKKR